MYTHKPTRNTPVELIKYCLQLIRCNNRIAIDVPASCDMEKLMGTIIAGSDTYVQADSPMLLLTSSPHAQRKIHFCIDDELRGDPLKNLYGQKDLELQYGGSWNKPPKIHIRSCMFFCGEPPIQLQREWRALLQVLQKTERVVILTQCRRYDIGKDWYDMITSIVDDYVEVTAQETWIKEDE